MLAAQRRCTSMRRQRKHLQATATKRAKETYAGMGNRTQVATHLVD